MKTTDYKVQANEAQKRVLDNNPMMMCVIKYLRSEGVDFCLEIDKSDSGKKGEVVARVWSGGRKYAVMEVGSKGKTYYCYFDSFAVMAA